MRKKNVLTFNMEPANRKEEVLQAALSIISRFGLQGLNYRAIADEANIPLGSTTYYFSSINDIQVASYELFQHLTQYNTDELMSSSYKVLKKFLKSDVPREIKLKTLIDDLVKIHLQYLKTLVDEEVSSRRIEAAFLHAAMVIPSIGKLLTKRQKQFMTICNDWFELLGVENPEATSHLYIGFVYQIERKYSIDHEAEFNDSEIKPHIEYMFKKLFSNSNP